MPEFQIDHRGYCFGGIETRKYPEGYLLSMTTEATASAVLRLKDFSLCQALFSDHRGYCFGGIETQHPCCDTK